ncbi:unnamed protein product [Wuchereria bancrofti]|uniref:Ornithine decarboxylase antizyme n=2 Tax=Wuchereria bancrofti TaxID=6293 RepID=A0A3P7EV21_WUCBA|nr:unnamed protein product [Wuchereria bancrofti]
MGRVRQADGVGNTIKRDNMSELAVSNCYSFLCGKIEVKSKSAFIVKVSSDWCCHLVEGNTLAIFLPFDQRTWNLSKGAFVSLLEFCEDNLPVKRILLCLNKISVDETVVSCFKYLGFNPLHPHSYPSCIDPQGVFAMVYNI